MNPTPAEIVADAVIVADGDWCDRMSIRGSYDKWAAEIATASLSALHRAGWRLAPPGFVVVPRADVVAAADELGCAAIAYESTGCSLAAMSSRDVAARMSAHLKEPQP